MQKRTFPDTLKGTVISFFMPVGWITWDMKPRVVTRTNGSTIVPDMHCPSHSIYIFRPSNYWVEINGEKKLFHTVWDGMMSYGPHAWSASEWCYYIGHCTKAGFRLAYILNTIFEK